jgi:hypothetical protein
MSSGDVIGELEQFSTWRDGARFKAVDFNFWGVTFASDPNTFYATLRTAGSTYLVRGDLALRRLTVLHDNVECPSISPDNRLLAFESASVRDDWRLAVDLQTMTERLIAAETRESTTRWNGWTPDTCCTRCPAERRRSPMCGSRRSTAAGLRASFFPRPNRQSSCAERLE